MFPDVDGDDWSAGDASYSLPHEGAVLIGRRANGEFLIRGDVEPSPARTEAGRASLGESFLEGIEGTESGSDRSTECTGWGAAFAGTEDGPEKAVVAVSAGVIAQTSANGIRNLGKICNQLVDRKRAEFGVIFQEIIGVGDLGLMVLAVMDFHRACIDVGLKRVGGVGQGGEFVCHSLFDF